jgi:hypothetical protein
MLESEVFPVVCNEEVDAPVGSAELETTTAPVFTAVTFPFKLDRVASVLAPDGNGSAAAEMGCVCPEPSTEKVPVPALAVTVPDTGCVGLFGDTVTTKAGSLA